MKTKIIRFLVFCTALLTINASCLADEQTQTKEPTKSQKVYYLQHKLIPKWVHQSGGAFFNDLNSGKYEKLIEAASQIVSSEFSAAISIKKYPDENGVLISFAAPAEPPECYYIYIYRENNDNKFSLFTYEKTYDQFKKGHKGVVGQWTAEMAHKNLGPRTYEDLDSFVGDVKKAMQR